MREYALSVKLALRNEVPNAPTTTLDILVGICELKKKKNRNRDIFSLLLFQRNIGSTNCIEY
jgi:hypothetical protein